MSGAGRRASDVNGHNATGPHRTAPRPNFRGNSDTPVTKEPVTTGDFTWERAIAVQSISRTEYPAYGAERIWFTRHAADAMVKSAALAAPAPVHALLREAANKISAVDRTDADALESVLLLRSIHYGQLEHRSNPDISLRTAPANAADYQPAEHFEMYDVKQQVSSRGGETSEKVLKYVQAPASEGGHHYEIKNLRAWPWTLKVTFELKLGDYNKDFDGEDIDEETPPLYAAQIMLQNRGKQHLYTQSHKEKDQCVAVAVGEINPASQNFVAWVTRAAGADTRKEPALTTVLYGDMELVHSLFYQQHWPRPIASMTAEDEEPMLEVDKGVTARYTFCGEDKDVTAYWGLKPGEKVSPCRLNPLLARATEIPPETALHGMGSLQCEG